ncbi:AMP-binding protein [Halobacteriovorax sp. RT-2-4]|uniref:AMP-binding protein n=1 Tax=unclassified Halobacteriovorax TaxID=2639665 RepID=UPI00399A14D3
MKKIEDIRQELGYEGIPINGCHYLDSHFRNNLEKRCLIYQNKDQNYGEFMSQVGAWIKTLSDAGIKKGDRVIVLIPLRLELYQIMVALFYMGSVVVSIDSTMPKDKLKQAIEDANAQGIISVKELLKWTPLIPALWKMKRFTFDQNCLFTKTLTSIRAQDNLNFSQTPIEQDAQTLISFTTGSTGRPKAANRSLDIFLSQKIVSEYFWLHKEDEVDMPFFPTLVLQNLGLGITTIFPDIDYRKLAEFDASRVIAQMNQYGVTRFSANPMIIRRLADYLASNDIKIPSLRSIIIGGAEISTKHASFVKEQFDRACSLVEIHIIYGSTEVEPISFVPIEEYISNKKVGLKLGHIIEVLDTKIDKVANGFDFQEGVVWGEICLSGPHVIKEYIDNHPANKTTKRWDEQGRLWHLTGDVGYVSGGQIYLLGRLKDCLKVNGKLVPTFHYENELARIDGVQRAALVQVNDTILCLIEGEVKIKEHISEILNDWNLGEALVEFGRVPVDSRHFSRVDRNAIRESIQHK